MTCGRITLRPPEKRDMELLRGLFNDSDIANWTVDYAFPVSSDMQEEWFQKIFPHETAYRFMVEVEGIAVGTIVFPRIDFENKTGEIGYKISKAFQGNNYATCALCAMQNFLFDEKGIECIIAYHFHTNASSRRVLEKAGFCYEGTQRKAVYRNGQRLDLVYWSCSRRRFEKIRKDLCRFVYKR